MWIVGAYVGLLADAIGIATGVVIFNALRRGLDAVHLGGPTVLLLAGVAVLTYSCVAAVPAFILARRPVGRQLAHE